MDDLTAEIKRLLEEDDPTITVQESIPQLNNDDSTPDAAAEPNGLPGMRKEKASGLFTEPDIIRAQWR